MKRISNRELSHHETIIALANSIERRSSLLQKIPSDKEINRVLREIEAYAATIKKIQIQRRNVAQEIKTNV